MCEGRVMREEGGDMRVGWKGVGARQNMSEGERRCKVRDV